MSLKEALLKAETVIASENIPDARIEAELLLMHSLSIGKVDLYAGLDRLLSLSEAESFWRLVEQRLKREPTAYILKHWQFYGIDLCIDSRALIPRPESELLVDLALEYARHRFPLEGACSLVDVGTGSGAIAIALALNLSRAEVYAIDVSEEALEVARTNCERYGVEERVHILLGDMLRPLPRPVHLVLANLPYVRDDDLPHLAPEIRDFEPTLALAGGADGLDKMRLLLPQAKEKLLPGGMVLIEIGQGQGEEALALTRSYFPAGETDLVPDLGGVDRVVRVQTAAVLDG